MRRAEDSDKRCTQVVHCGAHPGAAIMAATLRLSGPSARCHQWSPQLDLERSAGAILPGITSPLGCGFRAMPGNEVVFPVANKQDSSRWAACSYLIYLSPYLLS